MLFKSCIDVISKLQQCCLKVATLMFKSYNGVDNNLHQRRGNVVTMLLKCCLKVASMLFKNCNKVA